MFIFLNISFVKYINININIDIYSLIKNLLIIWKNHKKELANLNDKKPLNLNEKLKIKTKSFKKKLIKNDNNKSSNLIDN